MQLQYTGRYNTLDKLTCEDIKNYILDVRVDTENLRDYEREYYNDILDVTIKYIQGRTRYRMIHNKRQSK